MNPSKINTLTHDTITITIKDSPLEGKGVFAARDIKQGEKITSWNVTGSYTKAEVEIMSYDQAKRATKFKDGNYGLVSEPACFVNHSCSPNTDNIDYADIVSRDIKQGEEITGDYGSEDPIVYFDCKCGSQNCRGRVG